MSSARQYDRDLDPAYPKIVVRCGCGWAISTFDDDEQRKLERLGETHQGACDHPHAGVQTEFVDGPDAEEVGR